MTLKQTGVLTALLLLSALFTVKAGHADIAYSDDLAIDVEYKVAGFAYTKATIENDIKTVGLGIGTRSEFFEISLIASKELNGLEDERVDLNMSSYDRHLAFFGSIGKRLHNTGFLYKAGVGYSISEKVGVIAYYTNDKQAYFGLRKFF